MLINERNSTLDQDATAPPAPPAPLPSAADHVAAQLSRADAVLHAITRAGALLCAAIGATVVVAWFVRATVIVRFGAQTPMAINTALALTVTGTALAAVTGRRPRAALVAGVFDLALGAVVLAEYALGRGLGIDQLILHPYLAEPHGLPGRMAINTAVCLTLAGAALLAWGPWRHRRRPAALAVAGSLIAAIAIIAFFGYATSTPAAYGWGHLVAMALTTAVALLILALAMLSAAWRDTCPDTGMLPRWLPLPAGVLALGLAAAVWLTIAGRRGGQSGGHIAPDTVTGAATVLGLVMAGLVVLVVWLAQRADGRRQVTAAEVVQRAAAEVARRAAAERAAREQERRLFQFLDIMPVAVFVASPGGQPYYANEEAVRLLGRGVVPGVGTDQLAETYNAFLAGTDQLYPAEQMALVRAALGEPSHLDDMEIHKPDGTVIPLEVWGHPVYGADGDVEYAIAAFADMSERNAREKTIAGQAALLELAHDAIFVRDPDGRIMYWNAGAARTYGFTRAEALGRLSHDLLRTGFPAPLASIETATDRHGVWEGELIHRCADGRALIVESRWAAQRGPDGSLLGYMETNRDITSRKDAEHEMLRGAGEVRAVNATLEQRVQQRTVHLQRANQNLTAFSYSLAHDLRTPLRGVSGFAEALTEEYGDQLGATGRGYAGRIQAASGQMAAVLDDMLHLSQVSQAEMNPQDVDLTAEVNAVCDELRARDPGRRVQLTVEDGVRVTVDRP